MCLVLTNFGVNSKRSIFNKALKYIYKKRALREATFQIILSLLEKHGTEINDKMLTCVAGININRFSDSA